MCKNVKSLAKLILDLWRFKDLQEEDDQLNQSVNDGGYCRTGPATPGLLVTFWMAMADAVSALVIN